MKRADIQTVKDLTERTEADMMNFRNLGTKALDEIKLKLDELGVGFRQED